MSDKELFEIISQIVLKCRYNIKDCYNCPLRIEDETADLYGLSTICHFTEVVKILDEPTPFEIDLDALKEVIEL